MKQTAVEWLMDKLFDPTFDKEKQINWFEQAKEMERQQIEETWYDCKLSIICKEPTTADQYYNNTYKRK